MSSRLKIELIRACVSEKSKSWRMKLQKDHVFKRLTSGVNFFSLKLLSPNKYSWCVWFEQVMLQSIDVCTRKHTHNQKARTDPVAFGQKKEGLCLFWFKLVKIYSRDQANFFTFSRKIWFVIVFDFAQTFCGYIWSVVWLSLRSALAVVW